MLQYRRGTARPHRRLGCRFPARHPSRVETSPVNVGNSYTGCSVGARDGERLAHCNNSVFSNAWLRLWHCGSACEGRCMTILLPKTCRETLHSPLRKDLRRLDALCISVQKQRDAGQRRNRARFMLYFLSNKKKHPVRSSLAGGSEQKLVLSHDLPANGPCTRYGLCVVQTRKIPASPRRCCSCRTRARRIGFARRHRS